jgi:MoaA/NifB/PqqE/SkfB family radical SAM enzyme
LNYITEAAALGVRLVVFSGGEAFLLKDDLSQAVSHATALGLATRVVTNGYWAKHYEGAVRQLKQLKDFGLGEVNFSTGDEHQKFVPIASVVNGVLAAYEVGLQNALMIELSGRHKFTKQHFLNIPEIAERMTDERFVSNFHIIESPWMPFKDSVSIDYSGHDARVLTAETLPSRRRCTSIFNTIVVDPNERFGACCGLTREETPDLNVGSLREHSMRELMDEAVGDFIKVWLYTEGPDKILAWAASKNPTIQWQGKFAHICHSCRQLYKDPLVSDAIRRHFHERVDDVYSRFWLFRQSGESGSDAATTGAVQQYDTAKIEGE